MFGLFSKSPEEKFIKELTGMIGKSVRSACKDAGDDEMLQGIFIMSAIGSCREASLNNAPQMARQFNIPLHRVNQIIEFCIKESHNHYLEE
ncbi:hypothetical protein [Flavobacterium sp. ZS1P14]|uniref:hypothetical protein n=1 Tax=Flavobacterium sp. ZS1P14 TaxID=3401729 RepID=UPI003AB0FA9B